MGGVQDQSVLRPSPLQTGERCISNFVKSFILAGFSSAVGTLLCIWLASAPPEEPEVEEEPDVEEQEPEEIDWEGLD